MIDLLKVQEYMDDIKLNIPEIKTTYLVIDDSQITDIVKDLKESDNLILLGIVPSSEAEGQDEDDVKDKDIMAFLVLKKADRKVKHKTFVENLILCQKAAIAIKNKLAVDKQEYNNGCSFLNLLHVPSLRVDPIWSLAGTDGYEINFFMYSQF